MEGPFMFVLCFVALYCRDIGRLLLLLFRWFSFNAV